MTFVISGFSLYIPTARVDVDDIALSCSLFSDKVDNRYGLIQLQMDAFGCMVQGSLLTYMYSVGRHSRRSSSSRNRTGKPYAAHLARLGKGKGHEPPVFGGSLPLWV